MRRWFLSYHSTDQALAERIAAAIERRDEGSKVFLATKSLRAGGYWQKALADEIAQANVFVLLVGPSGMGNWQVTEYNDAQNRSVRDSNFPIVLVMLEGQTAPGLPFLRQFTWIITPDPLSEKDLARLFDAASGSSARSGELWRYTSPYRGLAAMEEKDSDYFFGRERETVDVLSALAAAADRVPVLLGNSGVGKSSVAQAGVLAALKRQAWPEGACGAPEWPHAFQDSRRWCFLTLKPGIEPLKSLVEPFLQIWQFDPTDPRREIRRTEWIENLHDGRNTLCGLLDATEERLQQRGQTKPPAFLLYVDQGEELYVRAEEHQRHRFSEVIAQGVADPRLYMLMSMRTDFLGELQKDEPLFKVHRKIDVPPLREAELCKVVSRPAELLSARFETVELADIITRRTAEDSAKDVGALPLLSYTLDDMWTRMVKRDDGVLRLPAQSFELGGVLVDRADTFLANHPKSQNELRRIFTKLATVREGDEPTRRRAARSEFTDEEWRLVSELADHPNRLVVTASPEGGESYAEVAHETIFRRWGKLREWIASEREFFAWRSGLEAARRAWQATPDSSKTRALLMELALDKAQSWLAKRREDLSVLDRDFIDQSTRRENKARREARKWWGLFLCSIITVVGMDSSIVQSFINRSTNWWLVQRPYWVANVKGHVLSADAARALMPGNSFRECEKDCPEMVVVPAGEFMMGSPANEKGRLANEGPQHRVTIARPFAVSKFEVTFADWDACVVGSSAYDVGVIGCPQEGRAIDLGWGRGKRPVIYLSWYEANQYVKWFSRMTGQTYRLLTEAEWEYAARAGKTTAYYWGDDIGRNNANCNGCGSQWDGRQSAPVDSFAPNAFGLFDMLGNVSEWVEDCYKDDYSGAHTDGSEWTAGDCKSRVVRGGSWSHDSLSLRSAFRFGLNPEKRELNLGFRIARTLNP